MRTFMVLALLASESLGFQQAPAQRRAVAVSAMTPKIFFTPQPRKFNAQFNAQKILREKIICGNVKKPKKVARALAILLPMTVGFSSWFLVFRFLNGTAAASSALSLLVTSIFITE